MKKNSAIISGMVMGTLTICPMTGWSQTSPGTSGSSSSATQEDQQRPKGAESTAGRSSMDSMKHSSATGHWSREDVKSVQEALKNKGHDPGPIDGVMGARTQQALRAFQRAQNIQTSGQLDSSTASALGVTLSSASGSSLGGSSGAPNRDSTVLEKNQGNPRSGGSASGTSGSSGSGSSTAGSVGSGTSTPSSKSTTIDPNEGNPKDRGAVKSGSSGTGSSGSGSSGAGSVGSGTSVPPSKSTTIDPNEGNPKDRGADKSGSSK